MPTTSHTNLPRPQLTIVPAKPGLPLRGGELDLLVSVAVDHPATEVARKPLSLALVIDCSGSMSGAPLEAAKRAAVLAVSMLVPGDRVAVVSFDSGVDVVQPLVRVGSDVRRLAESIAAIEPGGSTNLFGGWAEGLTQVLACTDDEALARVVLLSDGMANAGVTDHAQIARDVGAAASHGVTTTTLGLGRDYDEDLLRAMADGGRGNYVFLEDDEVVARAFEQEVAGLSSLRGSGVRLAAAPVAGASLRFVDRDGARLAGLGADASGLMLPDLIAGLPGEYFVTLSVEPGPNPVSLTLHWEDALANAQDEQTTILDLPWLDAADWDAAPLDERILQARTLIQVAAVKRRLADATRAGDQLGAEKLARELDALVAALPEGEARSREKADLARLLERLSQRDHYMVAKQAVAASRRTFRSIDDGKLAQMQLAESEWRKRKAEALGASQAPAMAVWSDVLLDVALPGGTQRFQVVVGDITQQRVDAVVNSTSRSLIGVSGVDGALARAGGPRHVAAMREIGSLDFGNAVFTPAYGIPARYVIHTAAQPWAGGGAGEEETLRRCYAAVYALAENLGVRSIAVPAIGTGAYRFPVGVAVGIAIEAARAALTRGGIDRVRFVAFDVPTGEAYVAGIKQA